MSTSSDFNSIIDAIKTRLTTNIVTLGGTAGVTVVTEGDEMPANIRAFPSLYIIPCLNGDHITTQMSNSPRYHEFDLTICGAYKSATVSSMLRTVRDYGFAAVDLFSLTNQKVSGTTVSGYCINPVLRTGYHQVKDFFVLTWSVELTVEMVTQ